MDWSFTMMLANLRSTQFVPAPMHQLGQDWFALSPLHAMVLLLFLLLLAVRPSVSALRGLHRLRRVTMV